MSVNASRAGEEDPVLGWLAVVIGQAMAVEMTLVTVALFGDGEW
jgi:hypothetical protein